jgi:nucleotide-binding universal stress UspA family protein
MSLIVCASRGGEAGRRTQERAIALAKERDADLVFLCAFDPDFAGPLSDRLQDAVASEQQWLSRAFMSIAQARARERGVKAQVEVLSGSVLDVIEEYLCESEATTLVIGEPKIDSPLSAFRVDRVQACADHVEQNTGVDVIVVTPED